MVLNSCRPQSRRLPALPSLLRRPSRAVACLVSGLLALPASAGEEPPATFDGVSPGAPVLALPVQLDEASALRERLAAIRLDVTVDRDLETADAALEQLLQDTLAAAPFDGAAALVAQVQISRAELALQRDQPERAAAILRGDQTPASAAPEVWLAALADPAVTALLARVEERGTQGEVSLDEEFLELVRAALEDQDERSLEDLGTRAVPSLLALADPATTRPVDQDRDPLTWVARLDPATFLREGRRLASSGQLAQPGRLVPGLTWLNLGRQAWIRSEGRPSRLRSEDHAALLTVVLGEAALHADARTRGGTRSLLNRLSDFDGVPAEAAEALARACLSLPDGTVRGIQTYLNSEPVRLESARVFHERLLAHADDAVRARAAESLVSWPAGPALLAAADDPAPQVRREVARALTARQVQLPWAQENGLRAYPRDLSPVLGPLELGVLARLAADPDPSVRRMAVTALIEPQARPGVDPSVYLGLTADADLTVRQQLTGFLHEDTGLMRQVLERLAGDRDPLVRGALAGREDLPADLADDLLARLAEDADPVVRQAVTDRLRDQEPATLAAEVIWRLAADPDPQVRRQLAYLDHADDELEAEVLSALARDVDPAVLRMLDFRVEESLRAREWVERADLWVSLLNLRRDHPTRPLVDGDGPLKRDELSGRFLRAPQGLVAAFRWALETDDPDDWMLARFEMGSSSTNHAEGVPERYHEAYQALEDDQLLRLLAWYQRDDLAGQRWLLEHVVEQAGRRVDLATTLWRDQGQALPVRLRAVGALSAARPEQSADLLPELIELFRARGPEGVLSRDEYRALDALMECLPVETALSLVEAMTASDQPSDQLAFEICLQARGVRHLAVLDEPRFLRAVLDRFAMAVDEKRTFKSLVSSALAQLDGHPTLMPDGWLEQLVRHPATYIYSRTRALFLIGSRRDPADLPFLADCLRASWLPFDEGRGAVIEAARNAVVTQLSDAAAEALLAAAAEATTDETRTLLMDGVRKIQDYQDALALWERRVAAGATREQTIGRLVQLIGTGTLDQRLQSIRALATLRAHDQLPLLIELLEDEHPAVAATARQTLDALHADPLPSEDG